jgi:hypothetical protein
MSGPSSAYVEHPPIAVGMVAGLYATPDGRQIAGTFREGFAAGDVARVLHFRRIYTDVSIPVRCVALVRVKALRGAAGRRAGA